MAQRASVLSYIRGQIEKKSHFTADLVNENGEEFFRFGPGGRYVGSVSLPPSFEQGSDEEVIARADALVAEALVAAGREPGCRKA